MEVPKYSLNFEIDACFDIKEDIVKNIDEHSTITLSKSKTKNTGSITFEIDTLNQKEAEDKGKSIVNDFLNCFLVVSNPDNMAALKFPEKPELLNSEKFRGIPKTNYAEGTVESLLVASLEVGLVEAAINVISKMNRLDNSKQTALRNCLFWLRKGAETKDNEKFIYRWISLEVLCGILRKRYNSTQARLNVLLNSYLKNGTAAKINEGNRQILDELVKSNIVGWNGAKRSEELKEAFEKNECACVIISKATLCVFEVRNNLFHKGESLSLVNECNSLLRDLISKTFVDVLEKPNLDV